MSLDTTYLKVSDGTGDASLMHVSSDRLIGSTTLAVDTLVGVPSKFIATSGTANSQGFIDPTTVTNFYGHTSGGNLIIDGYCPGSVDNGNTTLEIVIIKPNTAWANLIANFLGEWTAYTPVWTTTGAAPNIGNGTLSGKRVRLGKTTLFKIFMLAGSTTNFGTGSWLFSLPDTNVSNSGADQILAKVHAVDSSAGTAYSGQTGLASPTTIGPLFFECQAAGSPAFLANMGVTDPFLWAVNDYIAISGEMQSA